MQKVPMLDEDNNKIEVEINYNKTGKDENIFELWNKSKADRYRVKLVYYNNEIGLYLSPNGFCYDSCRQIKQTKRVPKEMWELPNPALMWVKLVDGRTFHVKGCRFTKLTFFIDDLWHSMIDLQDAKYTTNPQAKEPVWETFWKEV